MKSSIVTTQPAAVKSSLSVYPSVSAVSYPPYMISSTVGGPQSMLVPNVRLSNPSNSSVKTVYPGGCLTIPVMDSSGRCQQYVLTSSAVHKSSTQSQGHAIPGHSLQRLPLTQPFYRPTLVLQPNASPVTLALPASCITQGNIVRHPQTMVLNDATKQYLMYMPSVPATSKHNDLAIPSQTSSNFVQKVRKNLKDPQTSLSLPSESKHPETMATTAFTITSSNLSKSGSQVLLTSAGKTLQLPPGTTICQPAAKTTNSGLQKQAKKLHIRSSASDTLVNCTNSPVNTTATNVTTAQKTVSTHMTQKVSVSMKLPTSVATSRSSVPLTGVSNRTDPDATCVNTQLRPDTLPNQNGQTVQLPENQPNLKTQPMCSKEEIAVPKRKRKRTSSPMSSGSFVHDTAEKSSKYYANRGGEVKTMQSGGKKTEPANQTTAVAKESMVPFVDFPARIVRTAGTTNTRETTVKIIPTPPKDKSKCNNRRFINRLEMTDARKSNETVLSAKCNQSATVGTNPLEASISRKSSPTGSKIANNTNQLETSPSRKSSPAGSKIANNTHSLETSTSRKSSPAGSKIANNTIPLETFTSHKSSPAGSKIAYNIRLEQTSPSRKSSPACSKITNNTNKQETFSSQKSSPAGSKIAYNISLLKTPPSQKSSPAGSKIANNRIPLETSSSHKSCPAGCKIDNCDSQKYVTTSVSNKMLNNLAWKMFTTIQNQQQVNTIKSTHVAKGKRKATAPDCVSSSKENTPGRSSELDSCDAEADRVENNIQKSRSHHLKRKSQLIQTYYTNIDPPADDNTEETSFTLTHEADGKATVINLSNEQRLEAEELESPTAVADEPETRPEHMSISPQRKGTVKVMLHKQPAGQKKFIKTKFIILKGKV